MRLRAAAAAALLGCWLAPPVAPAAAQSEPNCAWQFRLDTDGVNSLYLDKAVTYWVTRLPVLPDSSLTITGEFPHSRYISFTTYDPRTRAVDSIFDAQIQPDAGSTNPFLPGASRTALPRSYAVSVKHDTNPPDHTPGDNTIYTESAEFFVVYRIYLADSGTGRNGGVALPAITYKIGNRSQAVPTCSQNPMPYPTTTQLNDLLGNQPQLPDCPGTDPPTWHRFYNFGTSVAQGTQCGNENQFAQQATPFSMKAGPGGFLEDRENAYLYTLVNEGQPEGPVLRIHARAPTTPPTFEHDATMQGGVNLRYWSVCSYSLDQRNLDCLFDQAIARNPDGTYTIAVASPANKPSCGNWLRFGSVLILRNQLPAPQSAFPYAVHYAHEGRSLQADMGGYFPAAAYITRQAFEQQPGCATAAPANAASSAGTARSGSSLPFTAAAARNWIALAVLIILGLLLAGVTLALRSTGPIRG